MERLWMKIVLITIEKTINCIHYLSNFGELRINITPADNLVFAYPGWLTEKIFLKLFPDKIRTKKGYGYGDIFVKMVVS